MVYSISGGVAMEGPLQNIRILDLTRILAGPYATMILGDLGADILKIERPEEGDAARGNGPFWSEEYSTYFMSLNRNKRSITLDLSHLKGKELFVEMVKQSDVVIENFVPGTMTSWGLDYQELQNHNPGLVYAAISGFGQDGPYARRPALDVVVQGMGGIMSVTGEPDGGPIRVGASIGDMTAGLYCAIGILAALQERTKSKKGQMLDISMLDCQVALQENAFSRYLATGEVPQRLGTRHPVSTPFQAFKTQDSWVVVAITGSEMWPLFCSAIDRVDLIDDERFTSGWLRTQNYDELEPIMREAMLTKTTEAWLRNLIALNLPCGPVNSIDQVVADPQITHREMIIDIAHPKLSSYKGVRSPLRLSRTPPTVNRYAPDLSEHTDEVLHELLGLGVEAIKRLRDEKVI
jgi:CoA:oxalate CoA-transferase